MLEYRHTRHALRVNVGDDEKKKFEDVMGHKSKKLLDTPLDYNEKQTICILMNQVFMP